MIEPGQLVSHYKILELVGGGGMGVVYKAEDTLLKRTVALKFLPPTLTFDPEAQERFIHEAQAASALEHANICSVHEIAEHEGQTFIVMGYYEGETLKEKIEDRKLKIEDGIDIAIQIAQGLARAHEAGIVHRDIKPANIMVTQRGEVKILDFGLARVSGRTMMTQTGVTLGTAAYMSPEQARGEIVDARTDIWSLGMVMYEMLTCHLPFKSDHEQALVYAILNEDPKPIRSLKPDVPEVVEQIVLKALAKNPDSRYQKAEDLLSDLKAARVPEQSGATIAATEVMAKKRKTKRRRILIAGGVILLVIAGVLGIGLPLLQDQALASNPRAIAFISFDNKTGDNTLDHLRSVLPDVLGTLLEDSRYLRVTSSDRLRELMKRIGRDTVKFIDRETGLQLCRRAGIDVMGAGSYTKAGPVFLTELELIDVNTGERLGNALKARGRGEGALLESDGILDDLAKQVSRGMGVSQMTTNTSVRSTPEVTSTSMRAQQYYQRGKSEREKLNLSEARSFLEQAVKEDSSFALAWYELAECCTNLGDGPGLRYAANHLRNNISRATELEKFRFAWYDTSLRASLLKARGREVDTRNWTAFVKARTEIFPFDVEFRLEHAGGLWPSAAIPEYERILQLDKSNTPAWLLLGYCYVFMAEGEKGMQVFEHMAKLQPGEPNPLHSIAEALLTLGRYSESIARCEEVLRIRPDFYGAYTTLAKLHFLEEKYDTAIGCTDRGFGLAPSRFNQASFLWWRAFYLVWAGRLREAEATLKRSDAILTAEFGFDQFILNRTHWLRGWMAYERGDLRDARTHLQKWAAATYPANFCQARLYPEFCLGLLDLKEGKMDSAESRLERMKEMIRPGSPESPRLWPGEDTWRYYGNALLGAYLLAMGRQEEIQPTWAPIRAAMGTLEPMITASWPVRDYWESGISEFAWVPVPFDILPQAYLERGMIDSAIAAYEIALRKPSHFQGPTIPRYYYRLARLYEQNAMKEKAIENYTQFLKVWGKADPMYKEPGDARSRLANLKRRS